MPEIFLFTDDDGIIYKTADADLARRIRALDSVDGFYDLGPLSGLKELTEADASGDKGGADE